MNPRQRRIECADVVDEFLFTVQRGPDHHFATAAAVLLRSLGYSTRAVMGFHAKPARYEARKRHISILAEDLHVWTEVELVGGRWVTVEPSPGFAVASPYRSWSELAWATAIATGHWLSMHAGQLVLLLILGTLAYGTRVATANWWHTLLWRWRCRRSARHAVFATLELMDHRTRLVKRPRPAGVTPREWFDVLLTPEVKPELQEFVDLLDQAVHSPASSRELTEPATRQICSQLERSLRLAQFLHAGRRGPTLRQRLADWLGWTLGSAPVELQLSK